MKNAFPSARTWLYVIVVTVSILKRDATHDYLGVFGEMTKSAGLLDDNSERTFATAPVSNPTTTVTSSGGVPTYPTALQEEFMANNKKKDIPKSHDPVATRGSKNKCPADILLMTQDVADLTKKPITVLSQDDKTVTFTISNPFAGGTEPLVPRDHSTDDRSASIFYQYAAAETGATKCEALPSSSTSPLSLHAPPVEITAYCVKSPSRQSSIAIVDVWLTTDTKTSRRKTTVINGHVPEEDGGDRLQEPYDPLPDKCFEQEGHDVSNHKKRDGSMLSTDGLFLYSYMIYCQPQCTTTPSESVVANHHDLKNVDIGTLSSKAMGDNDLLKLVGKDKKEHVRHCEASDYPCGGGHDANRVQVCHYSTKDGYRTHCIPQSDSSSLLGYFWKDYCGPCVVEGQVK